MHMHGLIIFLLLLFIKCKAQLEQWQIQWLARFPEVLLEYQELGQELVQVVQEVEVWPPNLFCQIHLLVRQPEKQGKLRIIIIFKKLLFTKIVTFVGNLLF